MAKKKEETTELTTTTPPGELMQFDYGEDAGKGFEHQTMHDAAMPMIAILQPNSPQVAGCDDGTIRAGMLYNTVTKQTYDGKTGLIYVAGTTRHYYAEWTPRTEGKGFHGVHEPSSQVVLEAMKTNKKKIGKLRILATEWDRDGNEQKKMHELVQTFYTYGIICTEEGEVAGMGVMSFKSTAIRAYREWIGRIRDATARFGNRRPPQWAHPIRITTERNQKDSNTWYTPVITSLNPDGVIASLLAPTDSRYLFAKSVAMLVDSGEAKVNYDQENVAGEAEAGDDIPF